MKRKNTKESPHREESSTPPPQTEKKRSEHARHIAKKVFDFPTLAPLAPSPCGRQCACTWGISLYPSHAFETCPLATTCIQLS